MRLPGVGGSLFPSRYLEDGLVRDVGDVLVPSRIEVMRRRMTRWWLSVEASCGPATGLRALFDLVAMPLCGMLGFRARRARFEAGVAQAQLESGRGTPVAMLLLPWARRVPGTWRGVVYAASDAGADWVILIAPPYVSIVDARGHAVRHSVDFRLPDALDAESFARLWLLARAQSFDPAALSRGPSADASSRRSALDLLVRRAGEYQDAVRADLQAGVIDALAALGPVVGRARRREAGDGWFDESLTVIYRVLFLLFAESRDLVPRSHPVYAGAYAVETLCREALTSEPVEGLWDGLAAISRLSRAGCRADDLIVRPFNGRLFARRAAPSLETRRATRPGRPGAGRDQAMRQALVALGTRPGRTGREQIAYADLGVEQLGAVYERVLDLDPAALPGPANRAYAGPRAATRHSRRRKETGTFYTPQALAEFVVRRTLEPLVDGRSADEILALRVVDPAMGSGAFLVAACRFLAGACERAMLEEGRIGEGDLDAEARANIRRMVAERCLAGVDINPVAVQLARLSLWLTTLSRGKPLGFLDHRLRVGNSLAGTSPDDLWRPAVPESRRRRAPNRPTDFPLFEARDLYESVQRVARPLQGLLSRRDDSVADVRAKERIWQRLVDERSPLGPWRRACDLWCAQWLWPETSRFGDRPSPAECRAAIDAILRGDRTLSSGHVERLVTAAAAAASQFKLFHWPLEFPDVFYGPDGQPRLRPGFDAVIGNPPWEMLRRDPREPGASARDAEARHLLAFLRGSGLYRNCGRGHVNLYHPFLERSVALARRGGRVGLILPWGLASDDGAMALRSELVDRHALDTVVGLDNGGGLFPIHRGLRFLAIVVRAGEHTGTIRGRFGVTTAAELDDLPGRDVDVERPAYPVRLTPEVLSAVRGGARRMPDARRPADLRLAVTLNRRFPPLGSADGWAARFGRELNATEDRGRFGASGLPVIEGKHVTPFRVNPAMARHHISPREAERALGRHRIGRARLAYRDVSGAANRLSLIAAVIPADVVSTHTLFCLRDAFPIERQHFLCALFNSYVLNALVRLTMGQHVTTSLVLDLPVPIWTGDAQQRHLAALAVRLAGADATGACEPELQAGVARLYGLARNELADLLEGFPLVPAAARQSALAQFRRGT